MRQERTDLVEELRELVGLVKKHEPDIGEAVSQIILANAAEGRIEKFLDSGTLLTLGEYAHRVCEHYKLHHEYIQKLEAEDVETWEKLLQKLGKWAYGFIRKKGIPVQADRYQIAEDCANEAGARLASIRFPYDIAYDSWACRVVQNVCLNYIRQHTEKIEYVDFDLSETDEWLRSMNSQDGTLKAENRIDLLDAISELSSEDRKRLIWLHYFEGKSFTEISKILDRSKNALYKLHFDALENLRKIFPIEGNNNEEEE